MKKRRPSATLRTSGLAVPNWRSYALLAVFALGALALEGRIVYLQLFNREFLSAEGDDRHLRTVQIAAHRGPIVDRNGEPLAVSTPVDSIWANPAEIKPELARLNELARVLDLDVEWLARRITSNLDREFVYLKRHLPPAEAAEVLELDIAGVSTLREYRRYYPASEVTGHVIGFTDIDDRGQEGLESAFDYRLTGEPGSKRVLQDRLGRVIGDVEQIRAPRPGRELRSSLDLRLQYLAYRELKAAVAEAQARSGSVVLLDSRTGEVLAMVNQPSFNPNNRTQRDASLYRNRAVTDIFEPGSTFKPLVLAAAFDSGRYDPDSIIDTSPGYLEVGGRILTEDRTHLGRISLTTVLARSSSVGIGKVGLDLAAEDIWRVVSGFGIGQPTQSGFPGESAGVLNDPQHWRPIGQATLSYGYGLAVTSLQLARAYAAIASEGRLPSVSFLANEEPVQAERVIPESTAQDLLRMLEVVVSPEGTGTRAAIRNYRVGGKTGTARISEAGSYADDRHIAVFAGVAPISNPQIVAVVVIYDPKGEAYSGGDIAAPAFSRVVGGALRILAIPPDALLEPPVTLMSRAEVNP